MLSKANIMICRNCGLWQYDNLLHLCYECGGELIHRFTETGEIAEVRS